jgi:hypothetical protein
VVDLAEVKPDVSWELEHGRGQKLGAATPFHTGRIDERGIPNDVFHFEGDLARCG